MLFVSVHFLAPLQSRSAVPDPIPTIRLALQQKTTQNISRVLGGWQAGALAELDGL